NVKWQQQAAQHPAANHKDHAKAKKPKAAPQPSFDVLAITAYELGDITWRHEGAYAGKHKDLLNKEEAAGNVSKVFYKEDGTPQDGGGKSYGLFQFASK